MANEENLKPVRSKSEARERGSKGGKKSGEVRKLRAQERKEWQRLLKMAMNNGNKEKLKNFSEADFKNLSVSDAMKIELIKKVLHGGKDSLSAYETVMKYSGIQGEDNAEPQEENSVETFLDALNTKAEEVWSDSNE